MRLRQPYFAGQAAFMAENPPTVQDPMELGVLFGFFLMPIVAACVRIKQAGAIAPWTMELSHAKMHKCLQGALSSPGSLAGAQGFLMRRGIIAYVRQVCKCLIWYNRAGE